MSVVIKSTKIIDPHSPYNGKQQDVLINKAKIDKIGKNLSGSKIIDGKGLILTPGWFDMQANFCDPGLEQKEDLETGRAAAKAGGFTQVALLPNTEPVVQSKNALAYVKRENASSLVELLPMAAVTLQTEGKELTEMIDLNHGGAVAFTDGSNSIWHTDILLKALQYLQKFNGLLINKPEDKYLNMFGVMNEGIVSTQLGLKGMPHVAEEVMVMRDLEILRYAGGRLHFGAISSARSVDLIRKAKKEGLSVTCGVAAHNLVFDDSELSSYDTFFKVNPPLRSQKDVKALIKGLADDTIDVVISDHAPQDQESKKLEFDLADFGAIGLQSVLPILLSLSELVPFEKLIEKVTNNPRELLKIPQPKVEEGELANLVLINPKLEWELNEKSNRSKSINSPFWGKNLKGKVHAIFNNGQNTTF